jgi:hypothetical protein
LLGSVAKPPPPASISLLSGGEAAELIISFYFVLRLI